MPTDFDLLMKTLTGIDSIVDDVCPDCHPDVSAAHWTQQVAAADDPYSDEVAEKLKTAGLNLQIAMEKLRATTAKLKAFMEQNNP